MTTPEEAPSPGPISPEPISPGPVPPAVALIPDGLADGEWHRLHPATPLLRGGLYLIAIAGILIANLREQLVAWLLPGFLCEPGDPECAETDPFGYLVSEGYVVMAFLVALGVLVLLVAAFYVSWRMHTFRITGEVVEVRSGVLFRTHRKARLDRIQGVAVTRPLFARLFGAAKLDVEVAGQDANVQLSYLGNASADRLRGDILRLASGSRAAATGTAAPAAAGSLIDRRVSELLAPELDPALAPAESVVRVPPGRLVASTALSASAIWLVALAVIAAVVIVLTLTVTRELIWLLFTLAPITIGFGSYLVNQVIKFLRYSIAATPDGVRIGYGLLSIRNDTLPPGRIHSIAVSQSLLWRPADWWTIRVNRASRASASDGGQAQQQASVVLPVGTRDDVFKVLELLLPGLLAAGDGDLRDLLERGLAGRGADADFTVSPRRAAVFRWFSWRRNGFALLPGAALLRRGAIWRELAIVPTPRIQSVSIEQGPIARPLRLAGVVLHTVAGPISPAIGAIDSSDAQAFFRDAAAAAVAAAATDSTHRWRSGEV